jgi:tRNA1(Val) A37 N6-methylase TrmN6
VAEGGSGAGLSSDAWLGGRLTLAQPLDGHRVGTDAALLAAALDLQAGRVVDVGAGVGAVGLAIACRSERVSVDLVERDAALATLAGENAARNGLAARVRAIAADVLDARSRRSAALTDGSAEAVVTNPPFFAPGSVRVSPDAGRASAHVLAARDGESPLAGWIRAALALLAPGGRFAMIHRPDALEAILGGIGRRLGGVALLPIYPRAGAAAHRLVVSGTKGSRASLRIAPGLFLHETDGRLTEEADAIHRGETLLDWGA